MPYQKRQSIAFNIFFYGSLILSVVYFPIHFISTDLQTILLNFSELDVITNVPDVFNAFGQSILLILFITIYIFSFFYLFQYKKDSNIDWGNKILSISLLCVIVMSYSSIIIIYDFMWNFVMDFPLDLSLLPSIYFPRLILVICFAVSLVIISGGIFLLLMQHFKCFNRQGGLIPLLPFLSVLVLNAILLLYPFTYIS